MSLKAKGAITGVGETRYSRASGKSVPALQLEASLSAIRDAGLDPKEIDGIIGSNKWIMGEQFTVVDGYALVFYGWGKRIGLPITDLKNYTAWAGRMLERPAVRRVLEREQSVLLAA